VPIEQPVWVQCTLLAVNIGRKDWRRERSEFLLGQVFSRVFTSVHMPENSSMAVLVTCQSLYCPELLLSRVLLYFIVREDPQHIHFGALLGGDSAETRSLEPPLLLILVPPCPSD
jgi:hypothetical protein